MKRPAFEGTKVMSRFAWIAFWSTCYAYGVLAAELAGPQIEEKVSGHTFAWRSYKFKESGVTTYHVDGSMSIAVDGYGKEPGKWRINADQLCSKVGKNMENCSAVSQIDEKTFFWSSHQTTAMRQD